jgi:hypothetical protein
VSSLRDNLLIFQRELDAEIDPSEFKTMPYDPTSVPRDQDIVSFFPKLKAIREMNIKLNKVFERNQVITYIMFVYDKNSPYRRRIKDAEKRKQVCAVIAGFDITGAGFGEPAQAMMLNLVPEINIMIVEYVRHLREHKFSYLISLEHLYHQEMKKIFEGEKVKIEDLEKIEKKLDEISQELLGDDKDAEIRKDLFNIEYYRQVLLRPEAIAQLLNKGQRFEQSRYSL